MKDVMSLGMDPDGNSYPEWSHGYHRYTYKDSTFLIGFILS